MRRYRRNEQEDLDGFMDNSRGFQLVYFFINFNFLILSQKVIWVTFNNSAILEVVEVGSKIVNVMTPPTTKGLLERCTLLVSTTKISIF